MELIEYVRLTDYAMGRDLQFPDEWETALPNALNLLYQVNSFLTELKPNFAIKVSSGFRPLAINSKLSGAAKRSLHMTGMAIDIDDRNKEFRKSFQPLKNATHADMLRRYGLWMEHPDYTPSWIHLDISPARLDRAIRVFRPYNSLPSKAT